MAITPINVARVSQNLQAFNLLATLRGTQSGLFRVQNQLATGLRFSAPSEDAVGAAHVLALDTQLEKIDTVNANLRQANAVLAAGESAMEDAIDLMRNAQTIASENVGDTVSADERRSAAVLVNGLLDQVVAVANRRHLDTYLFSGHRSGANPFTLTGSGVAYDGDDGRSFTIADTDFSQEYFTVSGQEFFGATSAGVEGSNDLNPALTMNTRISDLRGTTGQGVRLGRILVTDGSQQSEIDLAGADTVGDLIDRLNAEMPNSLSATLTSSGILVSSVNNSPTLTITDVGAGQAARDLGLHSPTPVSSVNGADLNPRVTLQTAIASLNAGNGINNNASIVIRSGTQSAVVDLSSAATVEDVINLINETNLGVRASIAPNGDSLNVVNAVSGVPMAIEENGGTLATDLGIRSNYAGTKLSDLNDGRGVQTLEGNDIRFVTRDGTAIAIDVDGAVTIQDVLDRINAAGAGRLTAGLAAVGNGIVITDNTAGAGTFRVERVNLSPALDGLGLNVNATGNTLTGQDRNQQNVDSAFTALIELRDALNTSDSRAINAASERLDRVLSQMQTVQGQTASQAKAMIERADRIADVKTAAQVLKSDVRDVDITEAVVRFQQMQNALQANLLTASRMFDLSLINYLR